MSNSHYIVSPKSRFFRYTTDYRGDRKTLEIIMRHFLDDFMIEFYGNKINVRFWPGSHSYGDYANIKPNDMDSLITRISTREEGPGHVSLENASSKHLDFCYTNEDKIFRYKIFYTN